MVSSSIFRLVPPKIPQELGGLQLGTGLGESWRWIGPLERCHARGSAARGLPRRIICWNFHWEFHDTFMGISWAFPVISWWFHGSFLGISWGFNGNFMVLSWAFPGHFLWISWWFHGNFLGISWGFNGNFIVLSWTFPGHFLWISWWFHGEFPWNFMGI